MLCCSKGSSLRLNIRYGVPARQTYFQPSRVTMRFTESSVYRPQAPLIVPSELSSTSSTEARDEAGRLTEPEKMSSLIEVDPRNSETRASPSTQRIASITLDLPQPLGPTIPATAPGNSMTVVSAKLLKPEIRSCFKRTVCYGKRSETKKKAP